MKKNRARVLALALLLTMVAALALFSGISQAKIGEPCPVPHGFSCVNGTHAPPGLNKACTNKHPNKNCPTPPPTTPPPTTPPPTPTTPPPCPPGTGPISGVVQQISDGIRDGGGAALADVIDQVNCGLIVAVLGL